MTVIYAIQNKVSFTFNNCLFFHIRFAVKYLVQQGAMSPRVKIPWQKSSSERTAAECLHAEKEGVLGSLKSGFVHNHNT